MENAYKIKKFYEEPEEKSFFRRVFLCLLAVLLAVYVAFGVYVSDYYHADLTDSGLRVYAAYGSEDGVLNREKYEADRINLPQNTTETVIDGGCHAGFGSYGAQKGDGAPVISGNSRQRMHWRRG